MQRLPLPDFDPSVHLFAAAATVLSLLAAVVVAVCTTTTATVVPEVAFETTTAVSVAVAAKLGFRTG